MGGRLATAGIVTVFALGGLAMALDELFLAGRHGPMLVVVLLPVLAPFVGARVAKSTVVESRYLHVYVIAGAALIGLNRGMMTRDWLARFWAPIAWYQPPQWYPPGPNAAWVAGWTFVGACAATLWSRTAQPATQPDSPPPAARSRLDVVFLIVVLLMLLVVFALPS
jgi:hypothetical protein